MKRITVNPKTKEFLEGFEIYCGRCFANFEDQYAHSMHRTHGGKSYSKCLDPETTDLLAYANSMGALVWKCRE